MPLQQQNHTLVIGTKGQGLYEFTSDVKTFVAQTGMAEGLLTIYCRHTSASLLIQENADPDVQRDLKEFFARTVPENAPWIVHRVEGSDDMPAHIKTALMQTSLSIPVVRRIPVLGTWQGIFLFEHRTAPHRREVVLHLLGG